ncbi:unnamed protein product [Musa hybrid cultivar]
MNGFSSWDHENPFLPPFQAVGDCRLLPCEPLQREGGLEMQLRSSGIYEHQIPREKSRGGIVRGIIMYYMLFRMTAYSLSFLGKRIQRKSYFVVEGLEKYCCLKLLLHKKAFHQQEITLTVKDV